MTRDEVEGRVRGKMVDHWGVDPARLEPNAMLGKDLGVDSLDLVELVMGLEEEFGVEIPDDEIDGRLCDQTVRDVFDVVSKYALPRAA